MYQEKVPLQHNKKFKLTYNFNYYVGTKILKRPVKTHGLALKTCEFTYSLGTKYGILG